MRGDLMVLGDIPGLSQPFRHSFAALLSLLGELGGLFLKASDYLLRNTYFFLELNDKTETNEIRVESNRLFVLIKTSNGVGSI